MPQQIEAPWTVRWIAAVLRALPAPTEAWASIIGSLAWPLVLLVLIYRFRRFIRHYLWIIADRLEKDHVKFGWLELKPNDQVTLLDPSRSGESTLEFDPADVERIERIFEFIDDAGNFAKLKVWIRNTYGRAVDIEEFLTNPSYATHRLEAFRQLEGLAE